MRKKFSPILTILFIFTATFFSTFFSACSAQGSSNATMDDILPWKKDSFTRSDSEFFFNYAMLEALYLWADNELLPEESYYENDSYNSDYSNTYAIYTSLKDDFTWYSPPELFSLIFELLFQSDLEVGLGLALDNSMKVKQVYPGSPAENAGILRGDSLISIDGIEISKPETFERLTQGEAGDKITLVLSREGKEKEYVLKLEEIVLPTVFLDYIDDIPLIKITAFDDDEFGGSNTYREWLNALEETQKAHATIVDLRDNPGGSIETCVDVASEILKARDTIVISREATWDEKEDKQTFDTLVYAAQSDGLAKSRYFVFLANEETASCAEILLVAATANKKSPIIGTQTYGKGIGQSVFITYAEGLASITSMEFFDKNGENYYQRGLLPDFKSENEEDIYAKALEFVETEQAREAGYGKKGSAAIALKRAEKTRPQLGAYKLVKDSLLSRPTNSKSLR